MRINQINQINQQDTWEYVPESLGLDDLAGLGRSEIILRLSFSKEVSFHESPNR